MVVNKLIRIFVARKRTKNPKRAKTMKTKLTLLVLFLASVTMHGQNAVAVYQQDGTVAKFAFTEKPVVTYSGSELVLTTTQTTVQYPIYLLKKISFEGDWTTDGIEAIKTANTDATFSFNDGNIVISGGEPGSIAYLYNIKGVKVAEFRLDDRGCVTIPTQGIGKDLHIVKTKTVSFKFKK